MSSLSNSKPFVCLGEYNVDNFMLTESVLQAAIVIGGSVMTLGYMYIVGKQSKTDAQPVSIYSELTAFVYSYSLFDPFQH